MTQTQDPIVRVKESNGELVLDYNSRVGARPFARFVDGEWDCMSLSHVPTRYYGEPDPDNPTGHNTTVHTVDLEPESVTEEELREMAKHPRYPDDDAPEWAGVEVIAYDESPFPDRGEIPSRDEIVRTIDCPECGEEFRQYLPDPFEECPHCGAYLEDNDAS